MVFSLSITVLFFVAFLNLCLFRALLSSPFSNLCHLCIVAAIHPDLSPSRHRATAPSNPERVIAPSNTQQVGILALRRHQNQVSLHRSSPLALETRGSAICKDA
ncbi:uncharacterized protein LOC130973707 isoform X2 [Arachis stenosperma]|uniref:uncharacterized protein LOC130973707 isoform X2 n=1 Tax=Arachis stenosperma TaxID=217475 RepID=UPI0025ABF1ED|nr:uncharacterized protein LOC130973707 isoform X2 [Arachis stenosperma]